MRTLLISIHYRPRLSPVTNTRDRVLMVARLIGKVTMNPTEQADTLSSGLVAIHLWLSRSGNLIQTAALLHKEVLSDSGRHQIGQSPLFATQSTRQTHPKRLKETQPHLTAGAAVATLQTGLSLVTSHQNVKHIIEISGCA